MRDFVFEFIWRRPLVSSVILIVASILFSLYAARHGAPNARVMWAAAGIEFNPERP